MRIFVKPQQLYRCVVLYCMAHISALTGIHTHACTHTSTHTCIQQRLVKKHVKWHSKWNEQSSQIKYNQHDSEQRAHIQAQPPLYIYVSSLHAEFFLISLTTNEKYQLNWCLLMVYLTVMFHFSNWHFQESEQQLLFFVIHSARLLYFSFSFKHIF